MEQRTKHHGLHDGASGVTRLRRAVYGTLAALRRMMPRDRGCIAQVGSALAYRSIPLQSAYCGAKHAIRGFTQSVHCELLHDKSNVRITMVQLPPMNTPQFSWVKSRLPRKPQPVPPIYQPEIAAEAIVYAAHHDRREIQVGLPTVIAIEGNKIIPGLLDQYLARTNYEAHKLISLSKLIGATTSGRRFQAIMARTAALTRGRMISASKHG